MSLYQQLRDKRKLYCQGKRPSVLKAACEYIETVWKNMPVTQKEIVQKYRVSHPQLKKRYNEIIELLGIPPDEFRDKKFERKKRMISEKLKAAHKQFYRGQMQ